MRSLRALMVLGIAMSCVANARAEDTGTIQGWITDTRGGATNPGHAVVFLCDAESGLPILKSTKQPWNRVGFENLLSDLWYAVSREDGAFNFEGAPAGKYRLLAQAWGGMSGFPIGKNVIESTPSSTLLLLGVAEGVEVKAGEKVRASVRKLGDGVLKIVNDPDAPDDVLLISLGERTADGVLGPLGWGTEFTSKVIGVTLMKVPYVTLVGLPDGETIHTGLVNFDTLPGFGGETYVVGEKPVVRQKIYAPWSDGHHNPPQRLAKLTDYYSGGGTTSRLLGLEGNDFTNGKAIGEMFLKEPQRKFHVEDIGDFTIADLLAASMYSSLRRNKRDREVKDD